jgi:carbamoylphosphate synthase large subunit
MKKIGLKTPPSGTAESMEQAMEIADQIGSYPLIIRPAFTLGGSGGGIAYNVEEFQQIVESGLQASVTSQACPMMPPFTSCLLMCWQGQDAHPNISTTTG